MNQQIHQLLQYYAQRFHVPIERVSVPWELENLDDQHIVLAVPSDGQRKTVGDLVVAYDRDFAKVLTGDLIIVNDLPVARVGRQWLVLLFEPKNAPALAFTRKLIDQHLPRLCRSYRHNLRDKLVERMTSCVQDRKRDLTASNREDGYELERLSIEVMQLSRKLETNRQLLKMFEKAPQWIRARSVRTYVDLLKLVPGTYQSFRFEDESIIGKTHPIYIDYEDCEYAFGAYDVEVNINQGKVFIEGGTEVNGYIHPHITDEKSNICWGNVGHLVQRLVGELDLFGLFQLAHQFVSTYNENDPYQKIQRWNPNWEDEPDDDEPYCSYCDDYGHTVSECDSCWWCEHCNEFVDHDEEDCPNKPKEESEAVSELLVEEQVA